MCCAGCSGLYKRATLWKHQKVCKLCSPSIKGIYGNAELPNVKSTTPTKNLLRKLRADYVTDIIIQDNLLVEFAERLASKGPAHYTHSRNQLREIGRLIEKLRELENDNTISTLTLINAEFYPKIIKAVSQLNKEAPSLGLRIGHSLIAIGKMYRSFM